ncbi:TetR/AcrR family transcriptional regulator [Curtobacterium aurantiacum]|uniref:TetR/AcrR family transcriptional regulator n=1 Tax=Curtobacterium aurantiacum TaxID=3236919 RepID=UPI001BE07404|nr:TetR/AcrR family transcriptional regulator [Curtobacterium flaccumfaciens]MBT1675688.1 TetR/AcrR family transcriptional regulator [Curtobacterium flaccumfaciens pv. flaccumfaciens]
MNKRRGRPSGRTDARARLLDAARGSLLERGYTRTTLRAVAATADVDVALIGYYFGSKRGLFSEAILEAVSPPEALAIALQGDAEQLPQRLLAVALAVWDDPVDGQSLRSVVTAALAEPQLRRALVEFLERELVARFADHLGGPAATARASAALTTIAGLLFTRHLLGMGPIRTASRGDVIRQLTPALRASLAPSHG